MKTTASEKQFPIGVLAGKLVKSASILLFVFFAAKLSYAAAEMTTLEPDPKSAAMGGGLVAEKSSLPFAAFNNPAALVGVYRSYLAVSNVGLPFDAQYNVASFALPTMHGTIGASLMNLNYGNFTGLDNNFNPTTVGATGESGLMLSYAFPLYSEVPVRKDYGAIGVNFKFLQNSLSEYTAQALAIDFGAIYHLPFLNGLSAGAVYKNFGSKMKFVTTDANLPTTLNFGLAYNNETLHDMMLTVDYEMPNDQNNAVSAGVAVSPVYFMSLRAGWKNTQDSIANGARFGFGFNFGSFSLDYAYTPYDNFGNINTVSLGVALGNFGSVEKASDYYLDKHFREAAGYYYRSDYIEARREFEDILSAYPDHAPSHKYLEKILAALEEKDKIKEKDNEKLLQKARIAYEKKNYISASKLYNSVLYTDPYNSEAKEGLDKMRKVVADIKQEEIVKKNLDLIKATWRKASQLYRKGDLVRAKEEFNNVLAIDPENQDAKKRVMEIDEQLTRIAAGQANELYSKGLDLYRKGQYAESIKYFEAVSLAAPNRLDAQDMIKRAHQNMNDIDAKGKAEKLAVEQEKMKGEMSRAFDAALKAYEKGNMEDALEKFHKSEQLAVSYEFEEYIQDTRTYLTVINQALTDKHYKLGLEYLKENRLETAVAELRKALDYNPENTEAKTELERISKELAQKYYEQGMAYFARSDMNKAKEMFRKSLFYEPDKIESKRAIERIE